MRPPRAIAVLAGVALMLGSLLLGGSADAFVTGPIVAPPLPAATGSELIAAAGGSGIEGAELAALSGVGESVPAFPGSAAVAVAIAGFIGGLAIGQTGARIFGFSDDQVCALNNGVLTAVAGALDSVDCTSFNNTLAEADKNADQLLGSAAGTKFCYTTVDPTKCIQLVGVANPPVSIVSTKARYQYCFAVTGGSASQFHLYWSDGTGTEAPFTTGVASLPACAGAPVGSQTLVGNAVFSPYPGVLPTLTSYGCSLNGLAGCPISTPHATVSATAKNPDRKVECDLTGSNGTVYTATTIAFKETDASIPPTVCPVLPSGVGVTHETLWLITVDGTSPPVKLYDNAPTGAYTSAESAYPDCGNGLCSMQVYTADPTSPCKAGTVCADWFHDVNKLTDFTCEYGPSSNPTEYTLALAECNTLANFYDPAKVGEGDAFADPGTGADTGVQTSPDLDHSLSNDPVPATNPDGSNADCFPTGWSVFNPLQWVFQPVQCAFRWAFIPAATVVPIAQAELQADAEDSPPGKIEAFVNTINWPAPATGCSGIDFDLSGWKTIAPTMFTGWSGHVQFLNACPGSSLAPWATWVNIFLTLVFVAAGIIALSRLAGKTFGYTGIDGE